MLTGEDHGKLRSFIALLYLHLTNKYGEFQNEQSKLHYMFSGPEGATLEQMIYLIDNDHMNRENVEAFITSLMEACTDPDHMTTTEQALSKICQGN
jgi:hypothetical protein